MHSSRFNVANYLLELRPSPATVDYETRGCGPSLMDVAIRNRNIPWNKYWRSHGIQVPSYSLHYFMVALSYDIPWIDGAEAVRIARYLLECPTVDRYATSSSIRTKLRLRGMTREYAKYLSYFDYDESYAEVRPDVFVQVDGLTALEILKRAVGDANEKDSAIYQELIKILEPPLPRYKDELLAQASYVRDRYKYRPPCGEDQVGGVGYQRSKQSFEVLRIKMTSDY